MNLPFTIDQFFQVMARYNESVWPMQVVLTLLALACLVLLLRPRGYTSRTIAAVLAFFWAWMGIAYHLTFFTAINPAAWFFGSFFLAGAAWLAWVGVVRNKLAFSFGPGARAWLGGALILFALVVYPLIGFLYGHRYPAMPTFGLPCPTTIFTIGTLLCAAAPLPRSVFIAPVLWSAIGSFAAFQLRVPQDYGLLAAGVIGVVAAILPSRQAAAVRQS